MRKVKTNILLLLFPICLFSCGKKAQDYLDEGNAKSEAKDYRGAIADYTKAIEIDPEFSYAYGLRGNAKFTLYDYRGSIIDYSKAIELDPNNSTMYAMRGISRFLLHEKEGACFDWSKAGELGDTSSYGMIQKHCQ
jgi:tetratricopeptide (TPR) repeat protein